MERLLVFTRYPEAGKVKTRLIPALGAEGAASLHRNLTRQTLAWTAKLQERRQVTVKVHFVGDDERAMAAEFGATFSYRRQSEGDLGQRLVAAIDEAFAAGAERVVVVGCDCPRLDERLAEQAFSRLNDNDVVLGPALDGGYYLIGLKRSAPELFAGIHWGGAEVLAETMHAAASRQLRTSLLLPLFDIDRPEDLDLWRAKRVELSIVIPTLNEAAHLADTLASVGASPDRELIVVDGGSGDETASIAASHGARCVAAPRGRARQMNWGAAMATGETLLFLHADTRLPRDYAEVVRETLLARNVAAGAFRLSIDGASPSERIIAGGANLRSRWLAAPYGDQGLFLKTEVFRELGGFADLPLLEDLEIVRRLRKRGRMAIAPAYATTSPRRWRKLGPWRTTWRNQRIVYDWLRGRPVEELARRYRRA